MDDWPPGGGNLPADATLLVGRSEDLRRGEDLLNESRLLCLTGVGGVGKSRLARELARRVAPGFSDGAWWIDVEDCADRTALEARLVGLLPGAREATDLDLLARALRPADLLLVLDGCEHLAVDVALLVRAFLDAAPRMRVLATSRVPLDVESEVILRVGPLDLVDDSEWALSGRESSPPVSEAARLFVERARAARPDGVPDPGTVAEICSRLDGLPLAIELAAARYRSMTASQILAGLDDRFSLLWRAGRRHDRHGALLASIRWSYDLLRPDERVLLRRLAVFVGGWTPDAAVAVTGFEPLPPSDVSLLLAGLVEVSMVQFDERRSGAPRYRLLDSLRAFAADDLAGRTELGLLEDRHLTWAAGLAERLEDRVTAADDAALAELEQEQGNLVAALRRAAVGPVPDHAGLRLVSALGCFWAHRGLALQGHGRCAPVIDADPGAPAALRAAALQAEAHVRFYSGEPEAARARAVEALDLATSARPEAEAARTIGRAHQLLASLDLLASGDGPGAARRRLDRGFEAAQDSADRWAQIEILQTRALSHLVQHRAAPARPLVEQASILLAETDHRVQQAWQLVLAGLCAWHDGSALDAAGLLRRGADAVTAVGDLSVELFARAALVPVDLAIGDLRSTADLVRACLAGHRPGALASFGSALGPVLFATQDPEAAARALLAVADRPVVRMGGDSVTYRLVAARLLIRAGCIAEAEVAAEEVGRLCTPLESPLAGGCDLLVATCRRLSGDTADAERLARRALDHLRGDLPIYETAEVLELIGALAVDSGRVAQGLELLAAGITAHRTAGHQCWRESEVATEVQHAAALLGTRAPAVVAAGERLDLTSAVARAEALARRRERGRRPPSGWASLTPAEHQVVALAAEGLSNPEIAARLYVSRATVKTHISHALTKLGLANRAQLAAAAARAASVAE